MKRFSLTLSIRFMEELEAESAEITAKKVKPVEEATEAGEDEEVPFGPEEEKPLLHILDTQKHPQPHMHKHANTYCHSENHQEATSQTTGTKEFEHKEGPLSVTSQVKKNKKMKQLMNFSKSKHSYKHFLCNTRHQVSPLPSVRSDLLKTASLFSHRQRNGT